MSSSDGRGELIVERTQGVWLLTLRGEHDLTTSETLGEELEAIFAHGSRVVIDLSETTFIDSMIMSRLVRGWLLAQDDASHALAIVAPPETAVRRLLRLVALDRQLPVYSSRAAAIRAVGSPAN